MVVAGEASGDLHAANMVRAMRRLHPALRFSGMGGDARSAGVEVLVDSTRLSVVGLVEVLVHYGDIRRAMKHLRDHLSGSALRCWCWWTTWSSTCAWPAFAKALGIKVLFYVSPQVWAWRSRRIKRIGRVIDAMAVLFPFEAEVYREHGIPVRYVGNPLVDQVRASADCYTCAGSSGSTRPHPWWASCPAAAAENCADTCP
jgi:lipid-A-disaccharide synthase